MTNMSLLFQFALLALLSFISLIHAHDNHFSVDGLKKCLAKSPELNECTKENARVLWPILVKGNQNFNFPPLDPFEMKELEFRYPGNVLEGTLKATNIKVIGLSALKFVSFDVKAANKKITSKANVKLSQLKVIGNYSGSIGLDFANFAPKGGFNILLENLNIEVSSEFELKSRYGHLFGKLTKLSVEPKPDGMDLSVDELVIPSLLSKTVIAYVNLKWRSYYDSVMPQTRKVWLPAIEVLVKNLLDVMPLENVIEL